MLNKLVVGLGCIVHLGLLTIPLWYSTDLISVLVRDNFAVFFLLSSFHCLFEGYLSLQTVEYNMQLRSHVYLPYCLGLCLLLGTWIALLDGARMPAPGLLMIFVAAGVFLLGMVLRLLSIMNLRQYFVSHVSVLRDHKLLSKGIHGWMRHPSESGLLMIIVAIGLLLNSFLALGFFLATILPLVLYRVRKEEQMMQRKFPGAYQLYQSKTPAFLPKFILK